MWIWTVGLGQSRKNLQQVLSSMITSDNNVWTATILNVLVHEIGHAGSFCHLRSSNSILRTQIFCDNNYLRILSCTKFEAFAHYFTKQGKVGHFHVFLAPPTLLVQGSCVWKIQKKWRMCLIRHPLLVPHGFEPSPHQNILVPHGFAPSIFLDARMNETS